MTFAVIGLGTNLGARRALLLGAIHALGARPGLSIQARSNLYETPPLGPPQPDFLNAALRVDWSGSPLALLSELHAVERLLGRERRERWGPRTIDLDLLWWGEGEVDEPTLRVPHPGLFERDFALAPLLDVLPERQGDLGPLLVELGGAPAAKRWPTFEAAEDQWTVNHAGDEADAVSLALSSAFGAADGARGPLVSLRFGLPIGDATKMAQACLEHARRAGFAPSWFCLLQTEPNAALEGLLLGQVSDKPALPAVSALRVEHGAESSKVIIQIGERA